MSLNLVNPLELKTKWSLQDSKENQKNCSNINATFNHNTLNFDSSKADILAIPWNDVLYPFVLSHLSWQDLFRLRRVSKSMKLMVCDYFKSTKNIDLSLVCSKFTLSAFEIITQEKHNLQVLNLSSCKWLTNDHLLVLIERNSGLTYLNVSNCFEVTNQCLEKLAVCCKNLKSIKLKECHWVNGLAVIHLSNNCKYLEDIDLTSCWEIADESAVEIISKCNYLRSLSLSKIYGITDHVLLALATYSKNLEYLNISGCWRVTDYGIRYINLQQ